MSELPREAADLLALAKSAHDPPDPEAIVRVRQRVALVTAGSAAGSLDALTSAKAKGVFASLTIKIWGTSLLVATLLSGLVFALLHRGPSSPRVEPGARGPEVSAPAQTTIPGDALAAGDVNVALLGVTESPVPVPGADWRAQAPSVEKKRRPPSSFKAPKDSLAAEVRLLKASTEALSAQNPALALQLLDQYQESFRSPMLQEEHDGLRIVARCAMTDAQAPSAARQLLAKSPTNVLRESLIRTCQLRDD